ncbi:MAG TPA: creatininase family protein [Bryobacteraceae bacterium]|nr:creatininase family protein [Bryobacteraceae bacterium]
MNHTANRPIDEGDWNMAFLFPDEVAAARERNGLVILPLAPLEWHGPHLAMGCDNLLAHAFARRLARELECPYYPPLYVSTERQRRPEVLEALGLERTARVEGMDFPNHSVASGYFREEVFALVLRDVLHILFERMRFQRVLIVNGHGADNQKDVLNRICHEFNSGASQDVRVMWVYPGFPRSLLAGSIGHAAAEETSMLESCWPGCSDLARLPKEGPLRNVDYGIVDGETFDCAPTPDHTVRETQDPRFHTDVAWGAQQMELAAAEVIDDVRKMWWRPAGGTKC